MKTFGLKASWLLPLALAVCGLFISGLSETAPDAEAETSAPVATEAPKPVEGVPAAEPAVVSASDPSGPELNKLSVSQSGRITSKGCLTDEAAIEDMQKIRAELEEKSKTLTKRETELQQKEAALAEELKKIETVRDEIKQANELTIGKNEEKINKLVETFESMSPKAAALVVNNIEMSLAVASLSKVSSQKLAKILAAMDPEDSGSLAEALTGVVRVSGKPSKKAKASASNDAAAATNPGNGGETKYGNQQQRNERQPASREPGPATGQ